MSRKKKTSPSGKKMSVNKIRKRNEIDKKRSTNEYTKKMNVAMSWYEPCAVPNE